MRGYFGIGIYQPKTKENVGTLWRSAYQLGAAFIFVIGESRHRDQPADTYHTSRHIPLFQYATIENFRDSIHDCELIGIEFDENGSSLVEFKHPQRAIYILGSEDRGFPPEIKKRMDRFVEIPSIRRPSYNVAMAGTIVMYDRFFKGQQ